MLCPLLFTRPRSRANSNIGPLFDRVSNNRAWTTQDDITFCRTGGTEKMKKGLFAPLQRARVVLSCIQRRSWVPPVIQAAALLTRAAAMCFLSAGFACYSMLKLPMGLFQVQDLPGFGIETVVSGNEVDSGGEVGGSGETQGAAQGPA